MYGKITEKELSPSLLAKIEGRTSGNISVSRDQSKIFINTNTIKLKNNTKTLLIQINGFDKTKDCLMVFENGTYMEENFDYKISENSNEITSLSDEWKTGTIIRIIALKNAYYLNQIKKITQIAEDATNVIEIGTTYDPKNDTIMVFKNSIYVEQDQDYQISDENTHIMNPKGKWNKDTVFNIIVFKNAIKTKSIDKSKTIIQRESETANIGIESYCKDFDILFAFENGTYIIRDEDYIVSKNSDSITSKKGKWENKTVFNFVVIGDILYNSNKVFESSYTTEMKTNTIPINNENYQNVNDLLIAFQNSVYMTSDEYTISQDDKNIVKKDGSWNKDTIFDFIILNDVVKDKKAYKGTTKLLSNDVKVQINIKEYNHNSDLLIAFQNGTFMDSSDYIIATDGQFIIKANQINKWNKNTIFSFIVMKNILNTGLVFQKTKILEQRSKIVNIEIPKFNSQNDKLLLFKNSVYVPTSDYEIIDNKRISSYDKTEWNIGTKFNIIVIKDSIESKVQTSGSANVDLSYNLANIQNNNDIELCKLTIKNLTDTISKLTKRIEELEVSKKQK